jgi:Kelch motif
MRRRIWILAGIVVLISACDTGDATPAVSPPPPASAALGALAWQRLAPAPSARTEVAAAVSGGRIFLAGGFRADGGTVSTVEVFDTRTGRWSAGPALPLAVNHAMAATVRGTVYVFGGHLASGGQSAAAFRLEGDAWRRVADLPEGRGAGTAVAIDTTVYVAGGVSSGKVASRMLVYDTSADRWGTAPSPPTPREHLGGGGFHGRVYTVGGRTGAGNLAAFEAYDSAAGRWTKLPDLPTPRGGLAAAVTCSGILVAVGGEASATFREAEAYDIRAGEWRSLPPLPTPRHGLGVVTVGSTLYTLSGGPQPGLHVADTTEAIDLSALGRC